MVANERNWPDEVNSLAGYINSSSLETVNVVGTDTGIETFIYRLYSYESEVSIEELQQDINEIKRALKERELEHETSDSYGAEEAYKDLRAFLRAKLDAFEVEGHNEIEEKLQQLEKTLEKVFNVDGIEEIDDVELKRRWNSYKELIYKPINEARQLEEIIDQDIKKSIEMLERKEELTQDEEKIMRGLIKTLEASEADSDQLKDLYSSVS